MQSYRLIVIVQGAGIRSWLDLMISRVLIYNADTHDKPRIYDIKITMLANPAKMEPFVQEIGMLHEYNVDRF